MSLPQLQYLKSTLRRAPRFPASGTRRTRQRLQDLHRLRRRHRFHARLCRTRSPSHIKPVSGVPKRKLEYGEQRLAGQSHQSRAESPEFAGQRLGRASITRGNVGSSRTAGNQIGETALAGWGGRIRSAPSGEFNYDGFCAGYGFRELPPSYGTRRWRSCWSGEVTTFHDRTQH